MGLLGPHGRCRGGDGQPGLSGAFAGLRAASAPVISGRTNRSHLVTNRIALILGLILIAAMVADVMYFGTEHLIFLGKKMFDLMEWMAFWR